MGVLTKAKVASLRKYKNDFNGYVNNEFSLAEQFADREYVVSALYDQSVDGDIPLTATAENGIALGLSLPIGALISGVLFDVQTACTASGGSATIDVVIPSDNVIEADGIIVNDHTEANLAVGSHLATVQSRKVSVASDVYLTAGTAKFETGKMRVFIKYYMAQD